MYTVSTAILFHVTEHVTVLSDIQLSDKKTSMTTDCLTGSMTLPKWGKTVVQLLVQIQKEVLVSPLQISKKQRAYVRCPVDITVLQPHERVCSELITETEINLTLKVCFTYLGLDLLLLSKLPLLVHKTQKS